MEIFLFVWKWEKKKLKKKKKDLRIIRSFPVESEILLVFFSKKVERCIDLFIDYWIRRDWRGSNPQLPPWQGGALTNWTTIPVN